MGQEDREWYREKRIDWERGGLIERKRKKKIPPFLFWAVVVLILVIVLRLCKKAMLQ
jgi:hypothetical protein